MLVTKQPWARYLLLHSMLKVCETNVTGLSLDHNVGHPLSERKWLACRQLSTVYQNFLASLRNRRPVVSSWVQLLYENEHTLNIPSLTPSPHLCFPPCTTRGTMVSKQALRLAQLGRKPLGSNFMLSTCQDDEIRNDE